MYTGEDQIPLQRMAVELPQYKNSYSFAQGKKVIPGQTYTLDTTTPFNGIDGVRIEHSGSDYIRIAIYSGSPDTQYYSFSLKDSNGQEVFHFGPALVDFSLDMAFMPPGDCQ